MWSGVKGVSASYCQEVVKVRYTIEMLAIKRFANWRGIHAGWNVRTISMVVLVMYLFPNFTGLMVTVINVAHDLWCYCRVENTNGYYQVWLERKMLSPPKNLKSAFIIIVSLWDPAPVECDYRLFLVCCFCDIFNGKRRCTWHCKAETTIVTGIMTDVFHSLKYVGQSGFSLLFPWRWCERLLCGCMVSWRSVRKMFR